MNITADDKELLATHEGATINALQDPRPDAGDRYEIRVSDSHPIFDLADRPTILAMLDDLETAIPCLPHGFTFDAETFLVHSWHGIQASRRRTLGVILRFMIDAKMVPLRKVPKFKSGGRVRYTKI